jgi:hypothetical protein
MGTGVHASVILSDIVNAELGNGLHSAAAEPDDVAAAQGGTCAPRPTTRQ